MSAGIALAFRRRRRRRDFRGGGLWPGRRFLRRGLRLLLRRGRCGRRGDDGKFGWPRWVGRPYRLRRGPFEDPGSDPIEERLRGFRSELDSFTEHLDVVVFAPVLARQVGVTRDLLQHRVQLGRSGGDPLQVFLIEHKDCRCFRSDRDRLSRPNKHNLKRQKQRSRRNQWSALWKEIRSARFMP